MLRSSSVLLAALALFSAIAVVIARSSEATSESGAAAGSNSMCDNPPSAEYPHIPSPPFSLSTCQNNYDCPRDLPICDTFNGVCIQCNTDSDCKPAYDESCGMRCSKNGTCTGGSNCAAVDQKCYLSKKCVDCVVDADCPLSEPSCDLLDHTCGPCTDDSECRGDSDINCGSKCQKSSFSSNTCTIGENCLAQDQKCLKGISKSECVDCLKDSDCPSARPKCDTDNKCIQCQYSSDCRPNSDATCGARCSLSRCQNAQNCTALGQFCDGAGSCKQCLKDSQCPPSAPHCTRDGKCVGCVDDSDCPTDIFCDNKCSPLNKTCTGFLKCGDGQICKKGSSMWNPSVCVDCIQDADCKLPSAPYCSTTDNKCVECKMNSQCRSDEFCNATCSSENSCVRDGAISCDPSDPQSGHCVISVGKCAECSKNSDCKNSSLPVCSYDGHCVECTKSSDCFGSKSFCDRTSRQCVECQKDADCSTSSNCGSTCLADKTCSKTGLNCKAKGQTCSSNNTCVECIQDSDCPSARPSCTMGLCSACKIDVDCRTDSNCNATCNTAALPYTCSTDSPVMCVKGISTCIAKWGRCIECKDDSLCEDSNYGKFCHPDYICGACRKDSDCPSTANSCGLCIVSNVTDVRSVCSLSNRPCNSAPRQNDTDINCLTDCGTFHLCSAGGQCALNMMWVYIPGGLLVAIVGIIAIVIIVKRRQARAAQQNYGYDEQSVGLLNSPAPAGQYNHVQGQYNGYYDNNTF